MQSIVDIVELGKEYNSILAELVSYLNQYK